MGTAKPTYPLIYVLMLFLEHCENLYGLRGRGAVFSVYMSDIIYWAVLSQSVFTS